MKEMVGGCCVCSDERGWPENPLVYCDGQGCTVAVHQACYGIVTVPTGPWYCRKCESQERAARVRCELCPSRDGALKKTDNPGGWAHVVCALYIPEVRFGNVTTMEPIILQLIPPERYNKTCYICQDMGKGSRASVGACMQCNKSGCKQQFHVTCAQQLGLLCEEAGNYLDNVKYCGYCQYHYSKLKKGGNVKPIPPYKPISHEAHSSDAPSSPEKEAETNRPKSEQNSKQKKSGSTSRSGSSASISSGAVSGSQNLSNSSTSSHLSSTSMSSTTSGFVSGGKNNVSSSSSAATSNNFKDKDSKHSKSTNKIMNSSKGHDKDTSVSTSSSSTSKSSKSSKNNNSASSNTAVDSLQSSASSSSTSTSHKNDSKSEKVSSQLNPIVQPAKLTTTSTPSMSLASSKSDSKHDPNNTMTIGKDGFSPKFTTSNFTETIVVNSDSVFGQDGPSTGGGGGGKSGGSNSNSSGGQGKKRKSDGRITSGTTVDDSNKDMIRDVSVTLVPLQGYDRLDATDPEKNIKKFCISQPKGAEATATVTASQPEINLQNLNPNVVSTKQQQQQIIQNVQSTSSSSNNNNKQSANAHVRELSSPYQQQQQQPQQQQTVAQQGSTPSLVVSVPLSTANVPGVNLNLSSTTSGSSSSASTSAPSNVLINQGQSGDRDRDRGGAYSLQNIGQSSRHSPVVQLQNHHHHHHQVMLERHSPLVVQQQQQQRNVSPAMHSLSPIDHGPPGMVHPNMSGGDGSMLKITYEKQPNRLSAMQDDDSSRRSRSQSIDDGGSVGGGGSSIAAVGGPTTAAPKSKGRSSKKRGAANLVPESSPVAGHIDVNKFDLSGLAPQSQPQVVNTAITSVNNNSTMHGSSSTNISSAPLTNIVSGGSHGNNNSSSSNPTGLGNGGGGGINNPGSILSQQLQQQQQQQQQQLQNQPKIRRTPTIEQSPPSTSRTPEVLYTSSSSSSFSGLKFGYEAQTLAPGTTAASGMQATTISTVVSASQIKESPPSSPGSEAGGNSKKRLKKQHAATSITLVDAKDTKLFQNGIHHAAHMLGNQLNPNSSMAKNMTDTLNQEIEVHIANTMPEPTPHVGPLYPGKGQQNRTGSLQTHGPQSLSSMLAGTSTGTVPQNLEQLLERQWEQGSQFLMEQAQHFDIASLLSCLHQLKSENVRLEEHVTSLVARRDHLLAVNARLAIPLNPPVGNQGHFNNMHPTINGPTGSAPDQSTGGPQAGPVTGPSSTGSNSGRQRGGSQSQQMPPQQFNQPPHQIPLENGIDFRHGSGSTIVTAAHTSVGNQPIRSTGGRQSSSGGRGNSSSNSGQYANQQQQQQIYASHQTVVRRDEGGVKPS